MSIDVNVQNDLVIVTESSEDITVNVSNAAGPAGVGVPVGGTTGQVLKKFTNTNYDTYWAADASGLTSVGVSMPSAFSVSNSPLTSNGTIAVTGAGTASQYIRGDGQLANFPDNNGGGSSVNYYLNGSVNQGTFGGDTYYEMSKTPVLGAGTDFTRTNAQGNGYIASFITDAGDPSLLNIPGGNWSVEFYFQANSNAGNPQFYAELYKVDASNNFTLIGSGSTNPEGITNGTTVDQYFTSIPVPQTSLLVTDRLAVRIYVITSGRTITLHTEDGNLCEVLTTLSTGLNALNGLTSQVQYFATGTSGTDFAISSATDTHTFNLPTASATNRGALSSADWSTFSGKVGGSGATGQVAYWNGTGSQTGSNNLFWDAANSRLGIGTNAPESPLHLNADMPSVSGVTITRTGITLADANFQIINGTSTSGQFLPSFTLTSNFSSGGSTIGGFFSARITNSNAQDIGLIFDARTKSASALTQGFIATFRSFSTDYIRIAHNGNMLLQNGGTFTDSGQRLQVQGTTLLNGATTINGEIQIDSSFRKIFAGGARTDTSRTSTGTSTIFYNALQLTANNAAWSFNSDQIYTLTSGNINGLFVKNTFAPTSGTATFSNEINPTIFQSGGANGITRGLYVNPTLTAASDWRSIEWSNNSGWGLYGAGTAPNWLGGSLTINDSSTYAVKLTNNKRIAGHDGSGGSEINLNLAAIIAGYSSLDIRTQLSGNITFQTGGANTRMQVFGATGNVVIQNGGTFTDAGFRLDVNGTARVSGNVQFGTGLYWDNTNNRLGIGTSSPARALSVIGNISSSSGILAPSINSEGSTLSIGGSTVRTIMQATLPDGFAFNIENSGSGQTRTGGTLGSFSTTHTFAPTSGTSTYSGLNLANTINQTGGANGITRGVYINPTITAAADWRAIEWSNNSGWGLYGAGTAPNYLGGDLTISRNQNGETKILVSNTTSGNISYAGFTLTSDSSSGSFNAYKTSSTWSTYKTLVAKDAGFYNGATGGDFSFLNDNTLGKFKWAMGASSTAQMTLTAAGRLLLGTTTESTFLLDVNGTARVSDNLTVSKNQNAATVLQISNTTSGASANSYLEIKSSNGSGFVAKFSASTTPYKFISGNDFYMTNGGTSGDLAILNDNATGVIKLGAGGSSTAHMTIKANGRINMSSLPTSPAGLSAGDIWNDGGTLKIV
jgi:hypothetical protein